MPNIFLTADHHFDHTNILSYCNRPFKSVEEMNAVLVERWNSVVSRNDIVYYLGDFAFGQDPAIFRRRLNGQICLIPGSHDSAYSNKLLKANFGFIKLQYLLKKVTTPVWLCHYQMRTWPQRWQGAWHAYAHSHGKIDYLTYPELSMDVGVDAWNFYPVSYEQFQEKMNHKINLLNSKGALNA